MQRRGRSDRPGRRRATRVPALPVLALLVALAGAQAAAATTVDTPPPVPPQLGPRLVVGALQAVVGPADSELPPAEVEGLPPPSFGARVLVDNPGGAELVGTRLVVELHDAVTTRSDLRVALDGAGPQDIGTVLVDRPLDPIAPGAVAQELVEVDGADAGFVDPDDDVTVRPLVLSLVSGSTVLDQLRTAVIGVARPVARPLRTSVVLPLDGPTHDSAATVPDIAAQLQPGGRLDRLVRAVEAVPAGTLALAPAAHTLEDLERSVAEVVPGAADLLTRVRSVIEATPSGVVSSAYGLADVPALLSTTATAPLAAEAITEGRRRLEDLGGRPTAAAHLLTGTQTAQALDLAPVDVLVTRWDAAAGPDLDVAPSSDLPRPLRTARAPSGRTLQVLVADPWVERQLADADGEAGWDVEAHRVLAESAMVFARLPGVEDRPFVVVPPDGWDAPGRLPTALTTQLAAAPWLQLTDPTAVATGAVDDGTGWAPLPTTDSALVPVLDRLAEVAARFDGLRSAVEAAAEQDVTGEPTDAGDGTASEGDAPPPRQVFEHEDDLLLLSTTWPEGDRAGRATAGLQRLDGELDRVAGEVVVPADSAVTLTSERGVIPVTVRHPEGVPIDVVVEVASQGRLSFQDGAARRVTLPVGGTATVSFPATALGRGTSPLSVTVRTPEGDVVLARAILSVRATAVSRPALLTIAAVVLLLVVVGRWRQRQQPRLEVVR